MRAATSSAPQLAYAAPPIDSPERGSFAYRGCMGRIGLGKAPNSYNHDLEKKKSDNYSSPKGQC
jgi:hypothetical protein